MEGGKLGRAGVGNASDGCCGRGGALPAAWLHLPRPGGDDPSEARASRPFLPISPAGTARPAPPIGCRFRDASDSANQRGEARFGNFFLPGPGAVRSSRGGARREGPQEARATARKAGVERACWRLGARRATHSGTPARLSFTLVAFICSCACLRIDKGTIGQRNPGIRNSWYRVTLESALPNSKNAILAQNA